MFFQIYTVVMEASGQMSVHLEAWDSKLMDNMRHLFQISGLCDLHIESQDGQQFKAHSCVVASASNLLASLIQSAPSSDRRLHFELEGDLLKMILSFIYTGIYYLVHVYKVNSLN